MRAFAHIANSHPRPRGEGLAMQRQVRTTPRKRPRQDRSRATVDSILQATARVLKVPGFAFGHVTSMTTYPDNEMHYSAPGWHWN
jgi:hypothetical protein